MSSTNPTNTADLQQQQQQHHQGVQGLTSTNTPGQDPTTVATTSAGAQQPQRQLVSAEGEEPVHSIKLIGHIKGVPASTPSSIRHNQ
ncbi:hypothetical protein EDD11_007383 [Mortierella claussenii]|nr:hypothetical protein EDD11_007383 [Mortierella claussenii]